LTVLEPLADDEVRALLARELDDVRWDVDLVSASSNDVYRCEGAGRVVAVRIPRVDRSEPSAFWRQMGDIFGLTFPPPWQHLRAVEVAIGGTSVACPKVLATTQVAGRPVSITTWLEGERWEPDDLPPAPAAHESLGRFLATMHQQAVRGFGLLDRPLRPLADYHAAALGSARMTAERSWAGARPAADRLLRVMAESEPAAVATSCAVVMPDIAANQFLFLAGDLAAVVDLDAYVAGPVELELTVAEWCLTDPASFARGYRTVAPLPEFGPFRRFHRASMLLNEPGADVDRLLDDRIHFP
jgi:hypothetical protein